MSHVVLQLQVYEKQQQQQQQSYWYFIPVSAIMATLLLTVVYLLHIEQGRVGASLRSAGCYDVQGVDRPCNLNGCSLQIRQKDQTIIELKRQVMTLKNEVCNQANR